MDLWLQITLCVLGALFIWLLIYTVSVTGLKLGLTLLRKGELIGFENAKKLEDEFLRIISEQIDGLGSKTDRTSADIAQLSAFGYCESLLEAVIQGNQKQIDTIKEELNGK